MGLINIIKDDIKTSMKKKDKEKLSTLRMLLSTLEKRKIELKLSDISGLTDNDIYDGINKNIKTINQEIESLIKVDRNIDSQLLQLEILRAYLPEQLTADEVLTIISTNMKELGITSIKQRGILMGSLSKELKGKADMKLVSQLVGELLSK